MPSILSNPKYCHLVNPFPDSDTFWRIWERSLLKTLWGKEKLLVQAVSPFPTMLSTLSKTEIIIFVSFNLSSADVFNLVWFKILSCGNGLKGKEERCYEEKLHGTSNFSFSHTTFRDVSCMYGTCYTIIRCWATLKRQQSKFYCEIWKLHMQQNASSNP